MTNGLPRSLMAVFHISFRGRMTAIHLDDAIVLDNSLLLQSHAGGGGGGDGGVSGGGGKGPAAPSFRNRPPERALFANSMNDPAIQ